jgi:hypothetical protein
MVTACTPTAATRYADCTSDLGLLKDGVPQRPIQLCPLMPEYFQRLSAAHRASFRLAQRVPLLTPFGVCGCACCAADLPVLKP